MTDLFLFQLEMRPALGRSNALHEVQNVPVFGVGAGGWRRQLCMEGGARAELGPVQAGQEGFLAWLVRRGRELAPQPVSDQLVQFVD